MRTDISSADLDTFQKHSGFLRDIAVVLRKNIVQAEKSEDGAVYRMFSKSLVLVTTNIS